MNHAFFKALLFLGAGSIIHALSNEQDMRKMGGIVQLLPFTYAMMLIGSLSLVGFPFLTGFYSKDVILEVAYARYTVNGNFAYWLGSICVLFTSYYSFRVLLLSFLTPTAAFRQSVKNCTRCSSTDGNSSYIALYRKYICRLSSKRYDDWCWYTFLGQLSVYSSS